MKTITRTLPLAALAKSERQVGAVVRFAGHRAYVVERIDEKRGRAFVRRVEDVPKTHDAKVVD